MTLIRGLRIIETDAGVVAADEHHVTGVASGDFVSSLAAQSGSSGRGEVGDGGSAITDGKGLWARGFNPGLAPGNITYQGQPIALLAPVVFDERDLLAVGGSLSGDYLNYFTSSKATLVAGPLGLDKAQAVVSGRFSVLPLEGNLPLARWTIPALIRVPGADLTAVTSGTQYLLNLITGSDELRVYRWGTTKLTARMHVDGTPGAQAEFTLASGDVPADTWRVVWVTYNRDLTNPLRLYLGSVGGSAAVLRSSASGTGAVETAPGGEGVWTKPFSDTGGVNGIFVGSDSGASGPASNIQVGFPAVLAAQLLPATGQTVEGPTITVGLGTGDSIPSIGGVLWQYDEWTPEGPDDSTVARDKLATIYGNAGIGRIRVEHPLDDGNNFSNMWDRLDPIVAAGAKLDLTLGYTPDSLGGSGTRNQVPSSSATFASLCLAFITAVESRYGAGTVLSWSLWNEPDQNTFWAGTSTQLATLWAAVHDALDPAFPDILVGATEESTWGTFTQAIITKAHTDGRRLDHVRAHDYTGSLHYLHELIGDITDYCTNLGTSGAFVGSAVKAAVSEWAFPYSAYDAMTLSYATIGEPPTRTERSAAFVFAYLYEALQLGVEFTSFSRAQIISAYEQHLGAFNAGENPNPLPAFAALEAWLALEGGTLIDVSANTGRWPSTRAVGVVHDDGRIVIAYGTHKAGGTDHPTISLALPDDIPEAFTWTHRHLDHSNYHEGRLRLKASGTEADVLTAIPTSAMSVGVIDLTPAAVADSAPAFNVSPHITGTALVGSTLTCDGGTATGYPTPTKTYQWKNAGTNIGGATSSTYVAQSGDAGDAITCTVTATNGVGSPASATSNTITPAALTAPGQVTGLSATAGDTQAALSWTAPASNGGSAITTYLVEYRTPSGSGAYTTFSHGASTTPSITVTGLVNGSGYEFRVSAVNAIGTGIASATATATPASGTFDPTTITGLRAWYKADAGTSTTVDGTGISQWNDQSGNSRHLVQATSGSQPKYKSAIQNSLPVVRLDGTDDFLSYTNASAWLTGTPATIFIASIRRGFVADSAALVMTDGTASPDYSIYADVVMGYEPVPDGSALLDYRASNAIETITPPAVGTAFLNVMKYGTAAATRYVNGVAGTPAGTVAGNFSVKTLYIGARSDDGTPSKTSHLDYCEVLIYVGELSDTDRGNVETYLMTKWGIS